MRTTARTDLPFCTFIFCAIPTLFTLFLAYTAAATRATFAAELYLLITLLMIGALMTVVPTLGRPQKVLPLPVNAIWPVVGVPSPRIVRGTHSTVMTTSSSFEQGEWLAYRQQTVAEWERRRVNARAGIFPNVPSRAAATTARDVAIQNPSLFRHAFRNTIDPDGLCMQCNCPAGDEIHI